MAWEVMAMSYSLGITMRILYGINQPGLPVIALLAHSCKKQQDLTLLGLFVRQALNYDSVP